jgi:hypothetical protein
MKNPQAFKVAALNWLLTHGRCESMTTSTALALADLTVRGVDYEASDLPDFRTVTLDSGDSFTDATYGQAFAATVYPLDRDKDNWREGYEFWVGDEDIKRLLVSTMILGVLAADEDGTEPWQARAHQGEVARMRRNREANATRDGRD